MLSLVGVATAESEGAAADEQAQRPFSAFLFLWSSRVNSDLTIANPRGGLPINVSQSMSFRDILDNLDSAFMFYGDWTSGRWTVFGDWTHTKLNPSAHVNPAAGFVGVEASLKTQIGDLALAYQVAGEAGTRFDVFAGARYFNLDNTVALRTPGRDLGIQTTNEWVDATGGARARFQLAPRWAAVVQADYGGGGSHHSWQAWGYFGYQFDWGSVGAGWRYLHFKRDQNGSGTDMTFNGPIVGVVARF